MGDSPDGEWDRILVERFRGGDSGAGAELFERHRGAIQTFFRSRTRSDAEDLVQLTFLAFLEAKDRFRNESTVKTFLLGIANRQLLGYYRRAARDVSDLAPEFERLVDDPVSPLSLLTSEESERRLRRTLGRISEELRLVVHLHYWQALSVPEIATKLGLPVGTAASRLRRAREQIREIFQADSRPL